MQDMQQATTFKTIYENHHGFGFRGSNFLMHAYLNKGKTSAFANAALVRSIFTHDIIMLDSYIWGKLCYGLERETGDLHYTLP